MRTRPEATSAQPSVIAWGRAVAAIAAALLLAALTVRNGAVQALVEGNPDLAAKIWPNHPDVQIAQSMADIGRSAAVGSNIGEPVFARFKEVARMAPLAPEPFLVAGIRYDLAGKSEMAERAFLDARQRNPRSLPARYFLAQHYLRTSDLRALPEIAALSRLSPGAAQAMTPYLAEFARRPAAKRPLEALFRDDPALRSAVLSALATDPANASLIAQFGAVTPGVDAPWIRNLIASLINHGDFQQAWNFWAHQWAVPQVAGSGLFDSQFRDKLPAPPFNWELTSSRVGLAERQSQGLHLIFYGEEDGVLARQLVILQPGAYRLSAAVSGGETSGSAILWSVRCANSSAFKDPVIGPVTKPLVFTVPGDCRAIWIEMSGHSDDIGRRTEIDVKKVDLTKAARS